MQYYQILIMNTKSGSSRSVSILSKDTDTARTAARNTILRANETVMAVYPADKDSK